MIMITWMMDLYQSWVVTLKVYLKEVLEEIWSNCWEVQ